MKSTLGKIVHYTLTDADAMEINRRISSSKSCRMTYAQGGMLCAAIIVGTSSLPDVANLRVIYDGEGDYWAPSRGRSADGYHGTWTEIISAADELDTITDDSISESNEGAAILGDETDA